MGGYTRTFSFAVNQKSLGKQEHNRHYPSTAHVQQSLGVSLFGLPILSTHENFRKIDMPFRSWETILNLAQVELQAELDRRLFRTAINVADWVCERFDIIYSKCGTHTLLKQLDFIFQKTRLVPSACQCPREFLKRRRPAVEDDSVSIPWMSTVPKMPNMSIWKSSTTSMRNRWFNENGI